MNSPVSDSPEVTGDTACSAPGGTAGGAVGGVAGGAAGGTAGHARAGSGSGDYGGDSAGSGGAHDDRTSARLRIAAHNGAPEWGGAEIAVVRLLNSLTARGHTAKLWCGRNSIARAAREQGVDIGELALGGDIALHHGLRARAALRQWHPDVVIAGTFRKLLHLSTGAWLARVPLIARIGLSSDLPRNAKYRFLFQHRVAHTVVNSHDLRNAWLKQLPELAPERISVIYKGIAAPDDLPSRAEARRALGFEPGDVVVGGVGRLVEQKRFDRWLHVLADLPDHVQGVIVGDGPLRPQLHQRAAELGVAQRLRFTGRLASPWRVLPAFDVLLITSDRESMANVMLEAMAAGVPTVSTPVDGAREALGTEGTAGSIVEGIADGIVRRTVGGIVAPGFDAEALRTNLAPLLDGSEARQKMAQHAQLRHAQYFTPERSALEWEAVLRRIAFSAGRAPRQSG